MTYRLSNHAREEMDRRGIPADLLDSVMERPGQVVPAYGGKSAYQSQMRFDDGKMYLLRAIVDETGSPVKVVTVYRTSRTGKYWRKE